MLKWKMAAIGGVLFGVGGMSWGLSAQGSQDQVFELRVYQARDGKRQDLSDRFRDHTMAMFAEAGMTNVGYWEGTPTDGEDNLFVYMLAYPSREARDEMWQRLGENPDFQREIIAEERSEALRLVDTIDAQMLVPTAYSPIQ